MTNLISLSNIFKKTLWILPFIFLIIILTTIIVWRSLPQKPKPNQIDRPNIQPITQINSTFTSTNLEQPQIAPKELPIYSQSYSQNLMAQAEEISKKLGFSEPPKDTKDIDLGEGLTYTNKNLILANNYDVLNIYKDSLTISKSTLNTNKQRLSVEDLKTKASDFLNSAGFSIDLATAEPTHFKITSHDTLEVSDPNQATYVNFTFYPLVMEYPAVFSKFKNSISLDFGGNVLQLTIRNLQLGEKGQVYPILNLKDAINELLAQRSALINLAEPDTSATKNLSITLEKAYLAYYIPQNSDQIIQPVWVFEGADQKNQSKIRATYAVPAIASQYLKIIQP